MSEHGKLERLALVSLDRVGFLKTDADLLTDLALDLFGHTLLLEGMSAVSTAILAVWIADDVNETLDASPWCNTVEAPSIEGHDAAMDAAWLVACVEGHLHVDKDDDNIFVGAAERWEGAGLVVSIFLIWNLLLTRRSTSTSRCVSKLMHIPDQLNFFLTPNAH